MKKDLGAKPYVFPMPVLIIGSYSEDGTPDAMNAAWGTICDFDGIALYLSPSHKTVKNIKKRKAFTVAVADEKHVAQCDYVGIVSANDDKDKMKKSGFVLGTSNRVDAPVIEDLPLTLECELDYIDEKAECVYGKIVNVLADESILTDGKVDPTKLCPISYDPAGNGYFAMGKRAGAAFRDGLALKNEINLKYTASGNFRSPYPLRFFIGFILFLPVRCRLSDRPCV